LKIKIDPKTVFRRLLIIIIVLLNANVVITFLKFYFKLGDVYGLFPLFNFDFEKNIPTLFSSIILFISSALLFIIAMGHKRLSSNYLPWFWLGIIMLFLSIDETAQLHEKLIAPGRELFNTSGALHYAWIIPYGAVLLVLLVLYFRFIFNLEKKVMVLFILSGLIYVIGALGFEMISGLEYESGGKSSILFWFISTCEESLEMLGIAVFIYTLLVYIATQFDNPTISIVSNQNNENIK